MIKTIITHNGSFHADDVFAAATLLLVFPDAKIIRTRDPEIMKTGDIVFDVGRIYDGDKFFDHHQEGGAGRRENGISYASFGLIWKKFSTQICGEMEAEIVDKKLVQVVDALDNGIDLFEPKTEVLNYSIGSLVGAFNKTFLEQKNNDECFDEIVEIAKKIIKREIEGAKEEIASEKMIDEAYEKTSDKRLIILDEEISLKGASKYKEVLYVIHPYGEKTRWTVKALREKEGSFKSKKTLPQTWAGKEDSELQKITGVSDAIFCHNSLFAAFTLSREGALALAKIALK